MLYVLTLGAAMLGCPYDKLDAPTRQLLAVSARPVADGKAPPIPTEARAAMTDAVNACAAEHGWNADQKWEATSYTVNRVLRDEMATIATARGVDPARVEAAVRGLPADKRSPLEAFNPDMMAEMRAALVAEGVDMDDPSRANVATALARAWAWLLFLTAPA